MNRRRFLRRMPGVLALGTTAPGMWLRAAEPLATVPGRVLVVVQLSGGNDGLNTVIPCRNDAYLRHRPTLAIPAADVLAINDELGFHPALKGFAELLEAGRLAVVQGVGYPQPNRSHFESMDIWHTCRRKDEPRPDGWLGRYSERPETQASSDTPALHLGSEQQPFALAAAHLRTPTIRTLEQFRLQTRDVAMRNAVGDLAATPRTTEDDLLGFVQSSSTTALSLAERLAETAAATPSGRFPQTELGRKLGTIARLIASGLTTRVYYVDVDGFDTHARQADAHAALLRQLGDAVEAFVAELASAGLADRVLLAAFSEFGRRLAENASGGTDHGAAAPLFLAGTGVRNGLIGAHPSLTDLDAGDLRHHTDFRQVYAAILEHWLGCDSLPILGERFAPVPAIRG